MARYTKEEREKILKSRISGESIIEMSHRVGVSAASLSKWIRQIPLNEHGKFNRLHVGPPDFTGEAIKLIKEGVVIELPAHTNPQYIRALLGW